MIVDDEPFIRKGIITSIDWQAYDIEVVGEASNGKEALTKALELKPHIVLTDIRMPIMDGLEFSKLLKEQLPGTRVVILSGYDDFAYAREAVRLGARDYLLKPAGAQELISLVLKLKEEIVKEQERKSKEITKNIAFNANFQLIKSNFMNSILKGEYNNYNTIIQKATTLELDLSGPEYQIVVIDIDDYVLITEDLPARDKEAMKFAVLNISEEIFKAKASALVFYSEFDYLIGLININNHNKLWTIEACKEIQYHAANHLDLSLTIGLGNAYKSLTKISESYKEALIAMRNKAFRGKGSIIHINTVNSNASSMPLLYPTEEEKELLTQLKSLNTSKLDEIIDKIFSRFINSPAGYNEIKNICIRLIIMSISTLEEMGINVEKSLSNNFYPHIEIEKYEFIEDLKSWLKNLFDKFIFLIQDNKTQKYKNIVSVAIQYIEQYYHENIALADIAKVTYVTPNYFSRVFKEETGENFTEWLNQFRIEKAKLLLRDVKAKTYEIAEKVGYNDYKYFFYNFKKYAGCSPKEYRELKI
jgi:two-component system response regulator YesN